MSKRTNCLHSRAYLTTGHFFVILITLGVISGILPHFGISQSPFSNLEFSKFGNLFTMVSLLAPFLLSFFFKPSRAEYLSIIFLSIASSILCCKLYLPAMQLPVLVIITVHLFLLTLLINAFRTAIFWREKELREEYLSRLMLYLMVPGFFHVSLFFLHLGLQLYPDYSMDYQAYTAEQGYGVLPAFFLGKLFVDLPILNFAGRITYLSLPLVTAAAIGLQKIQSKTTFNFLAAFGICAFVGFLSYMIFPVSGPLDAFPGVFPDLPQNTITQITPTSGEFRNGMPSLHTAWALLVGLTFWQTRKKLLMVLAAVFFILTELATLGTGQHWLVDLVPAFPLTLFAVSLFQNKPAENTGLYLTASALTYLLWLFIIARFSHCLQFSYTITWLLSISIIAFSINGLLKLTYDPIPVDQ